MTMNLSYMFILDPTLALFECSQKYISCLKEQSDKHHLCRELSKDYLQCRMDRQLMASEDLDKVRIMGYMHEMERIGMIYCILSHQRFICIL